MLYMIGKIGAPQLRQIQGRIPGVVMLLAPGNLWQMPTCQYCCDNGVYAAFVQGRAWGEAMHTAYITMLNKIDKLDNKPLWVLLPDAVADWARTVELACLYLPILRQRGLPVAIALQDGCKFEEALDFAPDWVFVAGSTEWKESNIEVVCRYFQPLGVKVHVGRVNTRRRLLLCQQSGADSCDGTTLNKFRDATLPLIADTLNQPCLVMR